MGRNSWIGTKLSDHASFTNPQKKKQGQWQVKKARLSANRDHKSVVREHLRTNPGSNDMLPPFFARIFRLRILDLVP